MLQPQQATGLLLMYFARFINVPHQLRIIIKTYHLMIKNSIWNMFTCAILTIQPFIHYLNMWLLFHLLSRHQTKCDIFSTVTTREDISHIIVYYRITLDQPKYLLLCNMYIDETIFYRFMKGTVNYTYMVLATSFSRYCSFTIVLNLQNTKLYEITLRKVVDFHIVSRVGDQKLYNFYCI